MTTRAVLMSPLLHFFVLGGAIFALYAALDDTPPVADPDAITLGPAEAGLLADQFAATWNRPPTETELAGLMQGWALEEAHVREALALGLDQGDPVIRQRLNLKMQFLAESGAGALTADDASLQAHLDAYPERFETPAQLAFEQALLPEGADAETIRTALVGGADPEALRRASLLPARVPLTAEPAIDRMFGAGFAEGLSGEGWQGPVRSAYGQHMVRVTDRRAATLPPLADIRDKVEQDWRTTRAREMREAFGQALLDRYEVVLPPASEVLAP